MALLNKIRKDMKKSSYYVWFLGAHESKGLRGPEYITPVLRSLIQREKSLEPFKITLQVSHKGLKIIQNIGIMNVKPLSNKPEAKPNKNDVIKHFIPHHAVTCVLQEDDVVACILLLYNPVTRCPVHVHGYRCDSVETASLLTQQLTTLIERPDNQKKLNEIEGRLRAKGLLLPTVPRVNIPKRLNSSGSDGRSTTSPASESSGGSSGGCQNERITNLYDSLAAELREKLGMGTDIKSAHAPILLPPRDYDTVHRQKGNLTGIEMRRCLNENIVGLGRKTKLEGKEDKKNKTGPLGRLLGSSGGSSGIGSDHPPSPEHNGRYLDNQSTSDEEWAEHPSEESLFLVTPGERNGVGSWRDAAEQMSLPRAKRVNSSGHEEQGESPNRADSGFLRNDGSVISKRSTSPQNKQNKQNKSNIPIENFRKRNEKGNMSPVGVVAPRRRISNETDEKFWDDDDSYKRRIPGYKDKMKHMEENEAYTQKMKRDEENRKISLKEKKMRENTMKLSPQERFLDAKTKFLMLEKERLEEQEKNIQNLEKRRIQQPEIPISPEIIKTRPSWSRGGEGDKGLVRRNSFFEEDQRTTVKYREKESRGKSIDSPREELVEQKVRARRLSRSDSRNRFFSQEKLNGDGDYQVTYERYPANLSRRDSPSPRRHRTSREEDYLEDHRRHPRSDYDGEPEGPKRRGESPVRHNGARDPRGTPSDDEDEEQIRYYRRGRVDRNRRYSGEEDTPPLRHRYEEDEEIARRRRYTEDRSEIESPGAESKSPARRRGESKGRDEMPYDKQMSKNKKQQEMKQEMGEKEKRLSSNALAKEFKRRSQEVTRPELDKRRSQELSRPDLDKRRSQELARPELEKRYSYGDRGYEDRYRGKYGDDVGYPDKAEVEVERRNLYNRGEPVDLKRNSRELAKEFNRRSRGYSYEEDDPRRRWPAMGYHELNDRERYPGLDRPQPDERGRYPEGRRSRDEDKVMEGPRLSQIHMDKMPARYRHSFVEASPGLSLAQPRGHEPLHRTNSSVSSNRLR